MPRLGAAVLAQLARAGTAGKKLQKSARGGHPRRGKMACDVAAPPPLTRRAVVKVRVVNLDASGRAGAALHLSYVAREGVERDGSPGQLYGPDGPVERESFPASRDGEPHQFRIILSPEDAHALELSEYTRAFMRQVESDLGREVEWVAANHYNTDNPHVHIVLRGVDRHGDELRLDRNYLANGLRWRAQELATAELGLRSERDLEQQWKQEVSRERFTSLDWTIQRAARRPEDWDCDYVAAVPASPGNPHSPPPEALAARLEVLEALGLANRHGSGWALVADWGARLRALGERGDILATMHRAMAGQGDTARYRVLDDTPTERVIEGVVRKKGLHDELAGSLFAVVETVRGEAFYVRVNARDAEAVREGSVVALAVTRDSFRKPADETIARLAGTNDGMFTGDALRAELAEQRSLRVRSDEGDEATVSVEDFVLAHERRLGRLERHGFVKRSSDGRGWLVPNNLLEQLSHEDERRPRSRVDIRPRGSAIAAQVRYRGPTWLDALPVADLQGRAPFGFGAEVGAALAARETFLGALEIAAARDERLSALRALERRDLGERLAKEQDRSYVAGLRKGDGFTGVAGKAIELPSGQRYVQVMDDARKRFVLVPASKEVRGLEGRTVRVERDDEGRVRVQRGRERGE